MSDDWAEVVCHSVFAALRKRNGQLAEAYAHQVPPNFFEVEIFLTKVLTNRNLPSRHFLECSSLLLGYLFLCSKSSWSTSVVWQARLDFCFKSEITGISTLFIFYFKADRALRQSGNAEDANKLEGAGRVMRKCLAQV